MVQEAIARILTFAVVVSCDMGSRAFHGVGEVSREAETISLLDYRYSFMV